MKKLILIVIVVLALAKVQAQETSMYNLQYNLKPKFGLITGTGINWLSYGLEESNPRLGFNIGGVLNVPLNRRISLEFETIFSKKGGQVNYASNSWYMGSVNYNLYYFDFPVLLKCKVSPLVSLTAGFQPGYMVDANVEYIDPYVYGFAELNEDALAQWNTSLLGGISFGGKKRALDFRFVYGLNSVADSDYGNSFLGEAQNMAFQVCFTRYFGGK